MCARSASATVKGEEKKKSSKGKKKKAAAAKKKKAAQEALEGVSQDEASSSEDE
jgi:hypothetical protein